MVDDCDRVRAAIKAILRERAGVRTIEATTSEEAIELARRHTFDVVTSDINRCGMDGLEFLQAFKQIHPTVPVIIASGDLDETKTRRAKWLRAFGCLPKPFTWCKLAELVKAAIAKRRVCPTLLRSQRRGRFSPGPDILPSEREN